MRTTITAVLCMGLAALPGCGAADDDASSTGASDCQAQVRFEGRTYTEVGYVDAAVSSAGQAVLGVCDDQGPDAAGTTFPDDASTVAVSAVPGVRPREGIGRMTADGVQVFVSDGLDDERRAAVIARALGEEQP